MANFLFHFDTISNRAIGYIFFVKRINAKIIISLHDAIPHIGEDSWKENIAVVLFYKRASSFIFYSNYSLQQFETIYKILKTSTYKIKLQPYTINNVNQEIKSVERRHILFFGRLSFYKGIDILLKAIPIVLKIFPNEMFLIAGKSVYDFKIDDEQINNYNKNIQLVNEFIPNENLINYIYESKFVVCPYRDASQSGVLMTSKALGRTIVATNTGAFSEYVKNDFDGILCDPNEYDLAEKIISLLINDKYKTLEKNIIKNHSEKDKVLNKIEILKAYSN
jgi:glycosyltransferase involved in cell wall biosynthesis